MEKNKRIFEITLIFAKQKHIIIWPTVIVAIAAVAFSLLTPQKWTSTTTFKPDASSSMSLPIDISGLGGVMSSLIGGSSGDAQYSLIILNSRSLNEKAIRKFNLIKYFKISEPDTLSAMDMALKKLKATVVKTSLNDENGLLKVSATTENKVLSKNIAEFYLTELDKYNREFKLTKGKRNRRFFESRSSEVRNVIDSLTIVLRDFQKKNKAIDISAQTSSLVTLYADIVSQKMILDLELDVARLNYSAESPVVKDLTQRQKLMADRIKDMEKNTASVKPNYIIDIDSIPDLAQKYAQLMMNLEIQKNVYEYIYPQYEAARIEELKDMPTLEVVDYPRLAGMRSYPKRGMICVVAVFLGFFFSLGLALIKDQIEKNQVIVKQILETIFKGKSSSDIQP
jgi:tyrosine-protein kinase Etk/Wzc